MRWIMPVVALCCLLCSCAQRSRPVDIYHSNILQAGKIITVAAFSPTPLGEPVSPSYIANNFAKLLRPACKAAIPVGQLASEAEAFAAAEANGSDYLVLVTLVEWYAGAYSEIRAALEARVVELDGKTTLQTQVFEKDGNVLTASYLRNNPWELIEETVEAWVNNTLFTHP